MMLVRCYVLDLKFLDGFFICHFSSCLLFRLEIHPWCIKCQWNQSDKSIKTKLFLQTGCWRSWSNFWRLVLTRENCTFLTSKFLKSKHQSQPVWLPSIWPPKILRWGAFHRLCERLNCLLAPFLVWRSKSTSHWILPIDDMIGTISIQSLE